jgi:hypothetical protein
MKKISVLLLMTIYVLGTSVTFATVNSRALAAKNFSANAAVKARAISPRR